MNQMKGMAVFLILVFLGPVVLSGQSPTRVGTTTAEFLSFGYGSAGSSLGDAYVSMVNDVSAIYWNPAGLGFMQRSEAQFTYQPWILDISSEFAGIGIAVPGIGTFGLGMVHANYGEMDVITVADQEGTGEKFTADEYALSLSFGRQLTNWFAFGASAKYINSKIWHMNASAAALDLGVIVNTHFFSPTGQRADGMRIGMSIANYGTRMKYDGLDAINPIDILPDESGNFADASGQFRLNEWELPLIFRIGVSINAFKTNNHKLTLAVDALHPNNSGEYVNIGTEYELSVPAMGKFYLRGGYKGLWLDQSEYGLALGLGFVNYLSSNFALKIDYGYRDLGILGKIQSYTVGFLF